MANWILHIKEIEDFPALDLNSSNLPSTIIFYPSVYFSLRWSLYNSFTELAKKYSPARTDQCYRGLSKLFALT